MVGSGRDDGRACLIALVTEKVLSHLQHGGCDILIFQLVYQGILYLLGKILNVVKRAICVGDLFYEGDDFFDLTLLLLLVDIAELSDEFPLERFLKLFLVGLDKILYGLNFRYGERATL